MGLWIGCVYIRETLFISRELEATSDELFHLYLDLDPGHTFGSPHHSLHTSEYLQKNRRGIIWGSDLGHFPGDKGGCQCIVRKGVIRPIVHIQ